MDEPLLSVRILSIQPCTQKPIRGLDHIYSKWSGTRIRKVPILRVFGTASNGQSCCVHVHKVFPYLFIRSPLPRNEESTILDEENSVLKSIVDGLRSIYLTKSNAQGHNNFDQAIESGLLVHSIEKHKKTSIYGYNDWHVFFKLNFYSWVSLKVCAEILQSGLENGQRFQTYESHISYEVQFLTDYGLSGMDYMCVRKPHFRIGDPVEISNVILSVFEKVCGCQTSQFSSGSNEIDEQLRQTKCSIECDVAAEDVVVNDWSIVEVSPISSFISRRSNMTLNSEVLNSDIVRETNQKFQDQYRSLLRQQEFSTQSDQQILISQESDIAEKDAQLLAELDFDAAESVDTLKSQFSCPYFNGTEIERVTRNALEAIQFWPQSRVESPIPTAYSLLAPAAYDPQAYEWYDLTMSPRDSQESRTDWSFFCTDKKDESKKLKYVKRLILSTKDREYTDMIKFEPKFEWYTTACRIGPNEDCCGIIRHLVGSDLRFEALLAKAKRNEGIEDDCVRDTKPKIVDDIKIEVLIPELTVFVISTLPYFTGDGVNCPNDQQEVLAVSIVILREKKVHRLCLYVGHDDDDVMCSIPCLSEKSILQSLDELVLKFDPDVLVCFDRRDLVHVAQRAQKSIWSRLIFSSPTGFDSFQGRYVLELWSYLRSNASDHLDSGGLRCFSMEAASKAILGEIHFELNNRTLYEWFFSGHSSVQCLNYVEHRSWTQTRLLCAMKIIESSSELARVFGIAIEMVHSRGSQYRVESLLARTCHPAGYLCPSLLFVDQEAPVALPLNLEPVNDPPLKGDPTVVLDFRSLYPSIICAYNICFCTCVGSVVNYGTGRLGRITDYFAPDHFVKTVEDVIFSPNGVAFIQPHLRRGILPQILEKLLAARRLVKSKKPKSEDERKQLHWRQLGLKLLANVIYGYTAAHFSGRMSCVDVADSIVHFGRSHLISASNSIRMKSSREKPIEVVYGDTDSLFLRFSGWKTVESAASMGKYLANFVTSSCPEPMKFEFEKIYAPCALLEKKRYAGIKYCLENKLESQLECKGIEIVRRDGCLLASGILRIALETLFRTRNVSRVRELVQNAVANKIDPSDRDLVNITEFVLTREFRGRYHPTAPPPVFSCVQRRELSSFPPTKHYRVSYLISRKGERLTDRSVEPMFCLGQIDLDRDYYLTKQIVPPLQRLMSLLCVDVRKWFGLFGKKGTVRLKRKHDPTNHSISQYFEDESTRALRAKKPDPKALSICLKCVGATCGASGQSALQMAYACRNIECPVLYVRNAPDFDW